jgi:hypothetical protein
MTSWYDAASATIYEVHKALPGDVSLADRMKAVDDAYPFGPRSHHPYKQWLKARTQYLRPYGYSPPSKKLIESPLERMMRRAKS